MNELILICIAGLFITTLLLAIQYYKRWKVARADYLDSDCAFQSSQNNLMRYISDSQVNRNRLTEKYLQRINKLEDTLALYTNHPDEAVRMALYPKQKLVVSTDGCQHAGGAAILNFDGALELEGEVFQIESPIRMQGYWTRQGLRMVPLGVMDEIPPMDRVETFIYAV
jgi:hypothetical protein